MLKAQAKQHRNAPSKPIAVRINFYPPTVEEAVAAARDLADDLDGQTEIASGLMGIEPEAVRDEVVRIDAESKRDAEKVKAGAQVMVRDRTGASRAVVVERSGREHTARANRSGRAVVVERTGRISGRLTGIAPRAGQNGQNGKVRTFDLTRRT